MSHRSTTLALEMGEVVNEAGIEKAWKESVRTGLRNQVIPDLHDYLDVHRNIGGIAARLSSDVKSGHYRPSAPEFVTEEKKDGVTRRLAVPHPNDALVLQCIVDAIEPRLRLAQPTKRAYYSRSHMPPTVDRVDGTFAYPWWVLWPEFQERIWNFATTHDYVVLTDVANYFDAISLHALRNSLASAAHLSENLLNLLFFVLEALTWRPYFMPQSGVGLPQVNFDAPRLLAHAYLFTADRELQHLTNGAFVRWMDDINAGVHSREEGKRLLHELQRVLNSQGLQLNTTKSRLLTGPEVLSHFCVHHNRAVSIIQNSMALLPTSPATALVRRTTLRTSYRKFRAAGRQGHWDKVQKRYLSLFAKLGDTYPVSGLPTLLQEHPSLRSAIFLYLERLGYSPHRLGIVEAFLRDAHCEDEASVFAAVQTLLAWSLPARGIALPRVRQLVDTIAKKTAEDLAFPFGAALWLLAKYGEANDLMAFVSSNRTTWERSSWASRQVAAALPLLPSAGRQSVTDFLHGSGQLQGLQVAGNLARIRSIRHLDKQLSTYLRHKPVSGGPYPLEKVVLARNVLSGQLDGGEKASLRAHLLNIIADGRLRELLEGHD